MTNTDIVAAVASKLTSTDESELVTLQRTLEALASAVAARAGSVQAVADRDAGEYGGFPGMFADDLERRTTKQREAITRALLAA